MNKQRFYFTFGSLGATVVIYILYAHVLVPVLLPAKERPDSISEAREPVQNQELLEMLFPKDSWVFEGTDSLSMSEGAGMVLFKKFETLENNQWQVSPCAVLWFPKNSDQLTPEEKYRQAVVMEASNYALLEFDGAIGAGNLQLRNGQLNGVVTIRSKMKKPDASDDIEVVTSDVLFDFTQIRTQQEVRFRFGPNFGHGRQLTIEMANTDVSKKGETPNTIKRIELGRLSELRLYVENDDLTYAANNRRWGDRPEQQTAAIDAINPFGLPNGRHYVAYPQGTPQTGAFQLRDETGEGSTTNNTGSTTNTPQRSFSLLGDTNPSPNIGTNAPSANASFQIVPLQRPSQSSSSQALSPNLSEVSVCCTGIVDMAADSTDPSRWLLTFRNRVDVIRTNPAGGATDQLNCQELTVTFGPKNAASTPTTASAANSQSSDTGNPLSNFGSLSPLRIKAVGTPVIARSPENKGFQAVGQELEIDLVGRKISLTKGDEISVLYDQFNIRGKALYYAFDEKDGPGMLDIPGAGTLEGTTGTDRDKHVRLEWSDELKMLPDKKDPSLSVVQIIGKAEANISDVGNASADEVLIWCDMQKTRSVSGTSRSISANGKTSVDLKTLLMQNNVVLKTDTGEILTKKFEMTFQQQAAQQQTAQSQTTQLQAVPVDETRYVAAKPLPSSKGALSQLSFFGQGDAGHKAFYTVHCDAVDVLAHTAGSEPVVDQIILTKNVRLDERPSAADNGEPMHVSGQVVRITNPDSEKMTVNIFGDANVLGGHAVFQGRGVVLMGANINIDREKNSFWVDGKGRLQVSQQAASSGSAGKKTGDFGALFASTAKPNSGKQSIIIDWVGRMEFNGKQLQFVKDVDVNYSMMAINKSELITIYLSKPFYFFEKNSTDDIEPERVVIRGNIDLERDTFADNGGQKSHDKIRLTAIDIFPQTGIFKGSGPGYISSIFQYDGKGAGNLLSGTGGNTSTSTPVSATTSEKNGLFGNGLKFMQCNFNGSVEGNYKTGQVRFQDRVVTMLCPARSFRDVINTNNSRVIVANGMLLECEKLEINQIQQSLSNTQTIDLKAEGNSLIEMTYDGRYYLANAEKIKFDQSKTLFILEGSRNAAVELYEAPNLNAPIQKRTTNERISLNPVTKEARIEGISGSYLMP